MMVTTTSVEGPIFAPQFFSAAQKSIASLESENRKLTTRLESQAGEVGSLEAELSTLKVQSEELEQLNHVNDELLAWKSSASVSIAKLETELSVKTDMMNRLLDEKKQNFGGPVGKEYGSPDPDCEYK